VRPDGLQNNYYFGGGAAESTVSLQVVGILVLACILLLVLKRKHLMLPFLCCGLLIPIGQVVVIFGFHLQAFRVLILAVWVRIFWSAFLLRKDPFPDNLNALDKVFACWSLCNAIAFTLLWHDVGAFVNRLGFLYSTLGIYFLIRYAIRDREDVIRAIKVLAVVAAPIAIMMVMEHVTGRNPISFLTGVAQFPEVRNGSIRAQGPFAHSIIAGTIGAMLLPLFVGLWWQGKGNRLAATTGILSSLVIAVMSSSSTPIMTLSAGLLGLCFWPIRKSMQLVRWGLVLSLICVQVAMQAPIWFLMARLGFLMGGTGWHRAELIDQFVRHFGEWWLIGTQNNASWGLDMWDSINVYVNAGVEGGLITFILYIALMVYAFKGIGAARAQAAGDLRNERLAWAIGAALFGNTVAFLGIAYFDQSIIAWYALLVMISAAAPMAVNTMELENRFELTPGAPSPTTGLVGLWPKPKTANLRERVDIDRRIVQK
jgi:hypothetical protein